VSEEQAPPPVETLDLDRVEVETQTPALACSGCQRAIENNYYEVNSKVLCPPCHGAVMAHFTGPVGGKRLLRAALRGFLASLVGSVAWYAVTAITGYQLGLLAVIVGVFVGVAVKKGAEGRGGWQVQAIAIFFTYASICGSFMPAVWTGIKDSAKKHEAKDAAKPPAPSENAAAPAPEATPPKKDISAPKAAAALLFAVLVMFAIACMAPFLAGGSNIMGIIIIGIALWEAWKINKRAPLKVSGPFRVGAAQSAV
jgi:hypothetical protein